MSEWFIDFFQWVQTLTPLWAYIAILVIAFGENVLPPIPGDMVIVLGGYLVGVGTLNFALVVLLSTLGGALGFMAMYGIGFAVGDAVMDPNRMRWVPKEQVQQARNKLHRWGYGLVAANRFLSGLRSVISLTVGMAHMSVKKTVLFATLSAALWSLLITYLGYLLGDNWEQVAVYLRTYGKIMVGLIVLFVSVQIGRFWWKRRQAQPS